MNTLEYSFITREILDLTGVDLKCYKSTQVQRRLGSFLRRSGHTSWSQFFRAARNDHQTLAQLKNYLTINVSSFFRDADKYEHLREVVLPELLSRRVSLRIWSAGCSRGQEPYSLALTLAAMTGLQTRHQILATDIDPSALEAARAGGPYPADDVAAVPTGLLARYFEQREDGYWVADVLRRRVRFQSHNLLVDPFENNFDLIICRNVVIYFTTEVKERLYRHFHDALRPGGVLFVGSTEFMPRSANQGFETMGFSFYRRTTGLERPAPHPSAPFISPAASTPRRFATSSNM